MAPTFPMKTYFAARFYFLTICIAPAFSLCFRFVLYLYSDYPFLTCVSFIKDIENELICADDTSLYCDNHVVAADSLNEDQCLSPITLWV